MTATARIMRPNETEISCGGKESAWPAGKVLWPSQKLIARLPAVSFIDWLDDSRLHGVFWRDEILGSNYLPRALLSDPSLSKRTGPARHCVAAKFHSLALRPCRRRTGP